VASGVVLGVLLVGLLLLGRWGLYAILVIVGAVALWEFHGLSARIGASAPLWLLYPLGAYFAFGPTLLPAVPVEAVLGAAVVVGLTAFLFLGGHGQGVGRWAMAVGGALYIGMPFDAYLRIFEAAPEARALTWIFSIILTVVVSDAVALLVGQRFGRRPFFPAISPHKTLEGAVAGWVLAVPVLVLSGVFALGIPAWQGAVMGVLATLGAQAGDLVESQMKRLAGVKDSSHLIPGHGGVLDRLDSLLFPPIAVLLAASAFHVLV
jgi:phosphatidate cytidylyltransferase